MASIYPNRKNGKIISFKFKAYLGRDENGKQAFKCTTWIPEKAMSEGIRDRSVAQECNLYQRRDHLRKQRSGRRIRAGYASHSDP